MPATIGSLFSGYGGLDLAVEKVTGATPAWFVEYDEAPSKILAHHWPDVPNHGDVTKVDWEAVPPVDILTGGYPCQPFSQAGQRKGTSDERHLWPYVREAIRYLRPRLAFLENVAGHRSLGFDRVLGDMAEDGLHVRWTSLRASDVGAPHHRERIFILATPADTEGERFSGQQRPIRDEAPQPGVDMREIPLPDFGEYGPVVRRWERLTRPAPAPTELNRNNKPRLAAPFAEWMMGLPAGWVTSPEIGLSRAQQLKAIGNGVCPPQAEVALRELLEKGNQR